MNTVKWNNNKKDFKNFESAYNFAYWKAFYFVTFLNGKLFNRKF